MGLADFGLGFGSLNVFKPCLDHPRAHLLSSYKVPFWFKC